MGSEINGDEQRCVSLEMGGCEDEFGSDRWVWVWRLKR